jgi:hypothetical protein
MPRSRLSGAQPIDIEVQLACDSWKRMVRAYSEGLYPDFGGYQRDYAVVLRFAQDSNNDDLRQIVQDHRRYPNDYKNQERLDAFCVRVPTRAR